MSDVTARLDLPLIKPSQAQKHVTHNEALQVLDGLVQAALEETGATTPPFEPVDGTLFALGASPTDEWSDQGDKLALRAGGGWIFIDPEQGWQAFDKAEGAFKFYDGSIWKTASQNLENLPGVGIGTTSDSVNRLALSSDAALFNHAGAGHQLKVNKAGSGDTASLLFQSGFTGHAEMGLAGDTAFSIKVTDDGSTWFDALRASAATQTVEIDLPITGTAVQQSAIDETTGRVLLTGASATVLTGGFESRVSVSGTPDALVITTDASLASVPAGYMIRFRASATNIGATTLDIDGLGPLACVTRTGGALPAGYIRSDVDTVATFDGTVWVLDREAESETNANGEYTRLADGTQICSVLLTAGTFVQSATWAAAFSDAPKVVCSPVTSQARVAALDSVTTTGADTRLYDLSSGQATEDRSLIAHGRWF
ncbi:MAG: DUF2793 domain-containing protein [Pseudomonadota bacterium]